MKTQEEKFSDLTKRLRNKANTLCDEAANEIAALKAEVEKYVSIGAREHLVKCQEVVDRAEKAEAERDEWKQLHIESANNETKLEAERDRLREALEGFKLYCEHTVLREKLNPLQNDAITELFEALKETK